MNTSPILFAHPWGEAHLERHPQHRHPNLQAWDGADRYVLEQLAEQGARPGSSVLLLNDNWGALACALTQAGLPVTSQGDSFIAWQALQQNAARNQVTPSWLWATEPPVAGAEQLLIRLPKELSLLEHQLASLSAAGYGGQKVLLAGMDKHLPRNLLALLERYLEQPQALYGKYKARLFQGQVRPGVASQPWRTVQGLTDLPLAHGPGVFGGQHLDIGARFLIEQLPLQLQGKVCDLGCGNGALGLSVLARNPATAVTFCDESAWALASARHNVATHFPTANAAFHLGNGLEGCHEQFNHILLNPPFHRGFELETRTAHKLLGDAARQLLPAGTLWLVANRHLEYRAILQQLFQQAAVAASGNKFVVWRCQGGR